MVFNIQLKDCKELVSAQEGITAISFHHKFLSSVGYSYPFHKDRSVLDEIYAQKNLIEKYSIFEIFYLLSRNTVFNGVYTKVEDKIITEIPFWSDSNNFSQGSCEFILDGACYVAEHHCAKFKTLVCVRKNQQLIFRATLISNENNKGNVISISESKVDNREVILLTALANLLCDKENSRNDAEYRKFLAYTLNQKSGM